MPKTFLKAEWRKLVMANFSVDEKILQKYLPPKTEIDLWNGTCYVSLVGFMFVDTRVRGFKIPFHVNFEEVNLRFYVRYQEDQEWKRGVVFIKEIVSKGAVTFVANKVYNENYETMPTQHSWIASANHLMVEYKWKKINWNTLKVMADRIPKAIASGSEEEFITEHYWAYTKMADTKTSEYKVEHPKWEVYPVVEYSLDVDFGGVYGQDFAFLKTETPKSVLLAEGSEIEVKDGKMI